MRSFRSLSLALAATSLLLVPAAANAKIVYPSISSISPKTLAVGEKLTIKGKNFRSGYKKNTVVFKVGGAAPIFVQAEQATTKRMVVVVPEKLLPILTDGKGVVRPKTFKLRVIAKRFAKKYTTAKTSPKITGPAAPGSGGAGGGSTPSAYEACKAGVAATPNADPDSDGLANSLEGQTRTDPCIGDTDVDGMTDGYEYYSAIDLNSAARPYPGSRPWPNPLDPSDADKDFDGDGLTLIQEYTLFRYKGSVYPVAVYSDGTQNTGGSQPTIGDPARQNLDLDGNGYLTDDERDADGDGLSNVVEYGFRGTQAWWTKYSKQEPPFTDEKPYTLASFHELDATNPDTDGDGLADGADDQDHDEWTNFQEMELSRYDGYRIQPYNPCLPDPWSRTCSRYHPAPSESWPPFDGSQGLGDKIPFEIPNVPAGPTDTPWNGMGGVRD